MSEIIKMSGYLDLSDFEYVTELVGIDASEKCLGDQKNPWAVGCAYGVTLGKSGAGFLEAAKRGDWFRDPCVVYCGIWRRVKRLKPGRYHILKAKFKDELFKIIIINTPAVGAGVRGTTFTIDVADDGTTLVVVSEGELEIIGRADAKRVIVHKGQQMVAVPQKPLRGPEQADGKLLDELMKWKENVAGWEGAKELEIPENMVVELNKGRLNYTS